MESVWTFIQSLSAAAIIAAIAGLLIRPTRDLIFKFVANNIDYKLQKKIETLRSELRLAEDRIRAVTHSAFSLVSGRQAAIDGKKLDAIQALWSHRAELNKGKSLVETMGHLNLDVVSKRIESDEKLQQFFQMYDNTSPLKKWAENGFLSDIEPIKPFLSPVLWGLYTAYQSIITISLTQVKMFSNGITDDGMLQTDAITALLKAALPEHQEYIGKHGLKARSQILEWLDQKLLDATLNALNGTQADFEFAGRLMAKAPEESREIPADLLAVEPREVRAAE
jgi:hypothetical protein